MKALGRELFYEAGDQRQVGRLRPKRCRKWEVEALWGPGVRASCVASAMM